jgi:hypothetical protein
VAITDIFSKRKKRLEKAEKPDVYQYDSLPQAFRVQVAHIWRDAIGPYAIDPGFRANSNAFWQLMKEGLCREKGMFSLSSRASNVAEQCLDFLMNADTDGALDIIELSLRVIDRRVREMHPYLRADAKITQDPDCAIEELNQRFLEHAIGYQYTDGIIIRVDSQFIHSEVVKPALSLLGQPGYEGPADEFIRAFDHYRHGPR